MHIEYYRCNAFKLADTKQLAKEVEEKSTEG